MSIRVADRPLNWTNIAFITAVHVAGVAAVGWSLVRPPAWQSVMLGAVWYGVTGLSVTAGYHRLFAHRSYRCSPGVFAFYLLFGAAAVQNSALTWASDHRRHHAHTDEDRDPYDARQGLWWSHMGWMLRQIPSRDYSNVPDLLASPLVMYQHRFYLPLAVVVGGLVPIVIASAWSDPLGGLCWAGVIRLVTQYHVTSAVNSVAHRFGRRPYLASTSARDNVVVALVTLGEGYHNFHHRFPSDYRNGVRWLDYDPTKWLICALASAGLASDLKRVSRHVVQRARRNPRDSKPCN